MQKAMLWMIFANLIFFNSHSQSISTIPGWSFSQQRDACFLSPAGTDKGKILVYEIRKPINTSQQFKDWFNESVNADIQKEKWREPIRGVQKPVNNILLYVTEIADSKFQKWFLYYMGYQMGSKQVRLARILSIKDPEFFQQNATIATKHFAALAKQEEKPGARDGAGNQTTVGYQPQLKPDVPITNKPLKELPAAPIHSVIMHLEYEAGMGGGIYPVYNHYVLFKDGKIYKEPAGSLEDLDIANAQQNEPRKWGTWKMNGSNLITFWPAQKPENQRGDWKMSSYYKVLPAKAGETIEGNFKSISGGGNTALGGDVMVVIAANIVFNRQGKFSIAKTAGVNSFRDIWETNSSRTNEEGYYRLDGHTIEFKYNNGKKERRFFYFYPDSKEHFGIGAIVYMPKRK